MEVVAQFKNVYPTVGGPKKLYQILELRGMWYLEPKSQTLQDSWVLVRISNFLAFEHTQIFNNYIPILRQNLVEKKKL